MSQEFAAIVLDQGSGMCKAGFSGDDRPTSTFCSAVGYPRLGGVMMSETLPSGNYIGDQAHSLRDILHLEYPVINGVVRNWDDLEKIWHYIFYEKLRIQPVDHGILLTEAPYNPTANREKMAQLLFEKFQSPSVFVAIPAVLSLYSAGKMTGVVLDSGEGVSHTLPIYEGYVMPNAIKRVDFGGAKVTELLARTFLGTEYSAISRKKELVNEIKESLCFVSIAYESDLRLSSETNVFQKSYTLPDGQVITVGNERFVIPEILFRPSLAGLELPGLHEMIYTSVTIVDEDIRKALWSNVIISGGNTMFNNIVHRLKEELDLLTPIGAPVKVIAPPERMLSVWIGGSIVSSLSCFQEMSLSKKEYEEQGSSAVRRMFI